MVRLEYLLKNGSHTVGAEFYFTFYKDEKNVSNGLNSDKHNTANK